MSETAPRVVHVVHSLEGATGGPARTVPALARAQAAAGAHVELVVCAVDPDHSSELPVTVVPGAGLAGRQVARMVRRVLAGADANGRAAPRSVVHVHGLWRASSHGAVVGARRAGVPYLMSPRGMLDAWALTQRAMRKRLALASYQGRDLRGAAILHATAETEAESFEVLRRVPPVAVLPNGVDARALPDPAWGAARQGEPRRALFLSRVHPKKGLLELVEAWGSVRPAGWQLDIVGPDEGGHAAQVEQAVRERGLSACIVLRGPLEGEAKHAAFERAQLFVLPTKSENFGVVVAEALASGVPVLTTTAAPWEGVLERRCGWWVAPIVADLSAALAEATRASPDALAAMGARGAAWVRQDFGWGAIGAQMLDVVRWVLDPSNSQPDCLRTRRP